MTGVISSVEFVPLARKPTLLASDDNQLAVFSLKSNKISMLSLVKLHGSDINCLSYHRMSVFTGSDDKTISQADLDPKLVKIPYAPPAF